MQAIGEILSSRINYFQAEAWLTSDDYAETKPLQPGFGSFLKSTLEEHQIDVYGVVFDIVSGPHDQIHKPMALKKTKAELRKEQPQIFSLIKTEWHTSIIGFRFKGKFYCGLPPLPPGIHDFVYPLTQDEMIKLSTNLDFLRLLLSPSQFMQDEIIVSVLRNLASVHSMNSVDIEGQNNFLIKAGQTLAKLLGDDYERLTAVLKRLDPFFHNNADFSPYLK